MLDNIYKYNEKIYAEKILKNGFINKFYSSQLKIIGKYYKNNGVKPKEIKELIYEFCNKHIMNFSRVKYFRTINSVMNYVTKKNSKLVVIESINVLKYEIDYINKLNLDYNLKKLLFTIFIFNKLNKEKYKIEKGKELKVNCFGDYKSHKNVKKSSCVPDKLNFDSSIYEFNKRKIVKALYEGKFYLTFVEDMEEKRKKCEDLAINITDFNNIGVYFDLYNGKKINYIRCEQCNVFVKKTSNNRKYCEECWVEKERELKRKWWNNNKSTRSSKKPETT